MRRAQASLEYLSTYGFAFMAILIALGALIGFGVFDTSTLRSAECEFAPGIVCESHILGGEVGDALAFELRNVYGVELDVHNITLTNPILAEDVNCDLFGGAAINNYAWPHENQTSFACDLSTVDGYVQGETYDMTVYINFTQAGNSYHHINRGTIYSTAQ